MKNNLRIGILGTRGIPNQYGGFEQCAQYLAEGLAGKGHDVTVYNSSLHPYRQSRWNGVTIVHARDHEDRLGTSGQFLYDLNCILDARKRAFDVIIQLGYTSSSIWFWLWPARARHVVNMDGLEYKRSKYSPAVRQFLRWAERLATYRANLLVADNPAIETYLRHKYRVAIRMISYGASLPGLIDEGIIGRLGLKPRAYHLAIARIEPENHIRELVEAHMAAREPVPLVIVGGTTTKLAVELMGQKPQGIIFTGALYDKPALDALRKHTLIYFHGHSVGGTNPSLLEAMACGCIICAHDNPFNRSVLEDNACYFNGSDELIEVMKHPPAEDLTRKWRAGNLEKLEQKHQWPVIVEAYEQACYEVV